MNLGRVGHIVGHGVHGDGVSDTDAEVAAHDLVHQDLVVLGILSLVGEGDANSLLSLFA